MKEPVAALFKVFLDLGKRVRSDAVRSPLLSAQDLNALKALNEERKTNPDN